MKKIFFDKLLELKIYFCSLSKNNNNNNLFLLTYAMVGT